MFLDNRGGISDKFSEKLRRIADGPVVSETVTRLLDPTSKKAQNRDSGDKKKHRRTLFLEYRGGISDKFSKKLRRIADVSAIFTTQKLPNVLPALKCQVPPMLNSGVVYQIDCSGCRASYIGKTDRHFATWLSEHLKRTSPLGEHFLNCVGHMKDV